MRFSDSTRLPRLAAAAAMGLALAFAAAATLAATSPAAAKKVSAAPTNDDCLACHADQGATRDDGRPLGTDLKSFADSVHGALGLACVDCHADLAQVTDFPHEPKLARVDCKTCHADAAEKYAASVHAEVWKGYASPLARCTDCHGMHDILPAADPASRVSHFKLPETCGRCHSAHAAAKPGEPNPPAIRASFEDSIHGHALLKAGLTVAPNCATCHGSHEIRRPTDAASKVYRPKIPEMCGGCHAGIRTQYETSIHAHQIAAGNLKAPVCTDCHTSHTIKQIDVKGWRAGVVKECGTCHADFIDTYRDTFHGKVTSLGFSRVAMCADCHGAHDILPKSDPQSRVSADRRLATCQHCHPSATASFALYDPHADAAKHDRSPLLFYMAKFMKLLLAGVFGFFFLHTALWLPRSFKARREHRAAHASHRTAPPSQG